MTAAVRRLRNNRAAGVDGIQEELLKYGGEDLQSEIASIYNLIFTKHKSVAELKQAILIPLNIKVFQS